MFWCLELGNEPVCSKSNYPFYFLTLNHVHEYLHYALPQSLLQDHRTHKESFVREVGFEARGGAGLKGRAFFQVSVPAWRKGEIGVGKSNTQKFSLGRTEGALRTRSSGETEWRGRSRDIYFKPELNNSYKRRETKMRIDLQKEQIKTQFNKTAKMTQTLSCFHQLGIELVQDQIST